LAWPALAILSRHWPLKPLEKNLESMRDFIADAGHELHTPLSLARAKVEALQSEVDKEELNAIGRSVERMEKIVDGLMYLTEIDARETPSGGQSHNIKSMLEQIVDDFENRYNNKGVSLNLEVQSASSLTAESAFLLRCDPELMYRAVTNLVENALRYTEPGGQVIVGLALSGDSLKVSVRDTGVGIPAECQSRIFERFYRVDKSRSRASGGVGLGLSIVKSICIKHKGSVSVESSPGRGSCFTMIFDLH
jgi:Signal transduction histidine kinase